MCDRTQRSKEHCSASVYVSSAEERPTWVVSEGSSSNVAPGDGRVSLDRVENKEADMMLS
jgi:hypothetical protein